MSSLHQNRIAEFQDVLSEPSIVLTKLRELCFSGESGRIPALAGGGGRHGSGSGDNRVVGWLDGLPRAGPDVFQCN
uniref:Uncharacterized protein n=1 Tax=Salvator merianae TaxID=96440 RepID=A0A8D0E7J2_SALMN